MDQRSSNPAFLAKEWHFRHTVCEAALGVFMDGKTHTAREIFEQLSKQGYSISKKLVNSVLFSEGRRYVIYDRAKHTYQLKVVEPENGTTIDVSNDQKHLITDHEIRARYIGRNDEFVFTTIQSTSPAFFDTNHKGSLIEIAINEVHPVFKLLDALFNLEENHNLEELRERLTQANEIVELLMASWAKFELTQPNGQHRNKVVDARIDWGRNLRELLSDDET